MEEKRPAHQRRRRAPSRRIHALLMLAFLLGFSVVFSLNEALFPELVPQVPDIIVTLTPTPEPEPPVAETIQQMIEQAQPGGTVVVPAGIYRETLTINKPLTLLAERNVEIRGSDIWDEGWDQSGDFWISDRSIPGFRNDQGFCLEGFACTWQEHVFLDGEPLEQVMSEPDEQQFALDDNRRVILAVDPALHLVEVTSREYWVVGTADDVTIDSLVFRHAANAAQTGAITTNGHSGWAIRNSTMEYAHGGAVSFNGGADLSLYGNTITNSGQLGIHVWRASNVSIERNHIAGNNRLGFVPHWEAGGMKIVESSDVEVRRNDVYQNTGPGIWCDIDCDSVTVSFNRIYDNFGAGIIYELSDNGSVHGNAVWKNGHGVSEGPGRSGIFIQNSRETSVTENIVAWNGVGIVVWSEPRGLERWDVVTGIRVERNQVFIAANREWDEYGLAWIEFEHETRLGSPESANRGARNAYFHANPDQASWNTFVYADQSFSWWDLEWFAETFGEQDPDVIDQESMTGILNEAGIPTAP